MGSHLSSLDTPTALALLIAYPGAQALAETGVSAVASSLAAASHGRFNLSKAEAIVSAARATVGLMRRQQALALKLQLLGQAILSLNAQIQRVEEAIEDLFRQLPYDPSAFPVGGVQSLAAILAEVDNIHRFSTIKKFLSHFGWCPQTLQSGNFHLDHPRLSHAGNPYVRRMLWMLAIRAVQAVPVYREYFQRRTAAGKKKMHTIVAIGRKLLSVIYAALKTGQPYNPLQEVPRCFATARP